MGLSIHYKGTIKSKGALPLLIEEVRDIAEIYKWNYEEFKTEFPANAIGKKAFDQRLYGICFTPPDCETVNLSFLSNGALTTPWAFMQYRMKGEKNLEILPGASVKTQYAGISVHKLLIHLFDHLSKKYFRHFELNDEGEYWETRDEQLLEKKFKILGDLIQNTGFALENNPIKRGENFVKYFERILKEIPFNRDNLKNT